MSLTSFSVNNSPLLSQRHNFHTKLFCDSAAILADFFLVSSMQSQLGVAEVVCASMESLESLLSTQVMRTSAHFFKILTSPPCGILRDPPCTQPRRDSRAPRLSRLPTEPSLRSPSSRSRSCPPTGPNVCARNSSMIQQVRLWISNVLVFGNSCLAQSGPQVCSPSENGNLRPPEAFLGLGP